MSATILSIIKAVSGPVLRPLLERIPNPNERARAQEQLEQGMLNAVTSAMEAQTEINKAEANHPSVFVAGWRPAVGWICAAGIGWEFVFRPLLVWGAFLNGVDLANAPELDISQLMPLLMGILGLGAYRTYEKMKGVERNNWAKKSKDVG